jgi:hypothetical protein
VVCVNCGVGCSRVKDLNFEDVGRRDFSLFIFGLKVCVFVLGKVNSRILEGRGGCSS